MKQQESFERSIIDLIDKGNVSEVKTLLESTHNVDINFKDKTGAPVLFLAIDKDLKENSVELTQLLLDHGADPVTKDTNNLDATDFLFSKDHMHNQLFNLLQEPKYHTKESLIESRESSLSNLSDISSADTEIPTYHITESPIISRERSSSNFSDISLTDTELSEDISTRSVDTPIQTTELQPPAGVTINQTQAEAPQLTEEQQTKLENIEKLRKMAKMLPEGAVRQKAQMFNITLAEGNISDVINAAEAAIIASPQPAQEDPRFEKYKKMQKMSLPEGAIRQKMTAEGVAAADIDQFFNPTAQRTTDTRSTSSTPFAVVTLTDADFLKPVDEIRQKINKLTPIYIAENNVIAQAATHANPEFASLLINKLANAKDIDEQAKKDALIVGIAELITQTQGIRESNAKSLETAENAKKDVTEKYERIRALPYNSPELQSTIETITPPKATPAKQREFLRQAAIRKKYPNITQDERTELETAQSAYNEQKDIAQKREKSIKSSILTAIKAGIDPNDKAITSALRAINDTTTKDFIRESIREGNSAKESAMHQKQTTRTTASTTKKDAYLADNPSELSAETSALINQYHRAALEADSKDVTQEQREAKERAYEAMNDAIFADIVPKAIKLKKLDEQLKSQGSMCPELDKYIDSALTHHLTKSLSFKEDPTLKQNIGIIIHGLKTILQQEMKDPINQEAAAIEALQDLRSPREEMVSTLAYLGIKEDAVRIITENEYKALQAGAQAAKGAAATGLKVSNQKRKGVETSTLPRNPSNRRPSILSQ